jgi:hypothetical protein
MTDSILCLNVGHLSKMVNLKEAMDWVVHHLEAFLRCTCGYRVVVNQEEFKAVCCYSVPKTVCETTSFLCLAGLYWKMTPPFAQWYIQSLDSADKEGWTFCLEPTTGLWCLKLALTTSPILMLCSVAIEPSKMATAYTGVGQNHLFHILQISGREMEERGWWQVSMWFSKLARLLHILTGPLSFLSQCC